MSIAPAPQAVQAPSRPSAGGPAPQHPQAPGRQGLRRTFLFGGLSIALIVLVLVSAGTGQLGVPPDEVLGSVLRRLGIDWLPAPSHSNGDSALWNIRFPRVAMAVIIGAALAAAGLLMQAIFGNPLAEPGVVGVSSGAALGASATIVFNLTVFGEWTIAVVAFATGLVSVLLVYAMSRAGGKTEIVTLVLTGIAINAFTGAGLAFMTFLGDAQSREQIVFWQLGSLNGARWEQVSIILPLIAVGIVIAFFLARRLDLLSLGEKSARHLGVNVEVLR
ncbi:FecCD family ABC transporter permease, partial [Leucobacter sp. M11]|uniref:FecCD family ABC transporter permease n=1 Tax=Leucobacter sp. M11 TaxID=2993565 RepID=UPI002D7EF84D